ncbi:membrane protein insertion efficiency factor YidD [Thermodesulfobacteriota bacterium]
MKTIQKIPTIVVSIVFACLFLSCSHSDGVKKKTRKSEGLYSSILEIYRGPLNHLSAVRRGECPMYPSCSEYSKQAIHKHSFVVGWAMTMDRLMRCGRDEIKLAPKIFVNGEWRYYDPVENNDFWWSQNDLDKK